MNLAMKINFLAATIILNVIFSFPIYAEVNHWGMTFVKVPAGQFQMGLKDPWEVVDEMDEPDPDKFKDEMPAHTVVISNSFLLAKTEVTQGQWYSVMQTKPGPKNNWSQKNWQNYPVTGVSWANAQEFISTINSLDKTKKYRLPTEAEWEYAARAGSNTLRPVPLAILNEYAWFIKNSADKTHPVGTKKANIWGLHDMLGNVWEWTSDWYSSKTYSENQRVDPSGPGAGRSKVRKGGSFHCPLYQVRPGYRAANKIDVAYSVLGFRLVAENRK